MLFRSQVQLNTLNDEYESITGGRIEQDQVVAERKEAVSAPVEILGVDVPYREADVRLVRAARDAEKKLKKKANEAREAKDDAVDAGATSEEIHPFFDAIDAIKKEQAEAEKRTTAAELQRSENAIKDAEVATSVAESTQVIEAQLKSWKKDLINAKRRLITARKNGSDTANLEAEIDKVKLAIDATIEHLRPVTVEPSAATAAPVSDRAPLKTIRQAAEDMFTTKRGTIIDGLEYYGFSRAGISADIKARGKLKGAAKKAEIGRAHV